MKLIDVWIENFGKISRQHFDFTENCNFHYGENGSGKSTLAAFLKVMFFGFEGERKQMAEQNERRKYMPWQGGAYGGQITFAYAEKRYQIIRIFGTSASKDIFELRDADTNLFSQDFTENIGQEIFGLDRESFVRTVFIAQSKSLVIGSTGSIDAKLGYLAENTEDMGGYEQAISRLTKKLSEWNGRTASTSLQWQKNRITELETEIRQVRAIEEKETKLLADKLQLKAEYQALKQKQIEFSRQREEKLAQIAAEKAKKLAVSFSEEDSRRRDVLSYRFLAGVPEKNEIQEAISLNAQIIKWQKEAEELRLTEEETVRFKQYQKAFSAGVPEEAEIDNVIRIWQNKEEKKQELMNWQTSLEIRKAELEKTQVVKQKKLLFMGLLIMLGVIASFFWRVEAAILVGLVGSAWLALRIWRKDEQKVLLEGKIKELSGLICEEQNKIAGWETDIQNFFADFQMPYKIKDMPMLCYDWKRYVSDYWQLNSKKEIAERSDLTIKLNNALAQQEVFFRTYKIGQQSLPEDAAVVLLALAAEVEEYQNLCQRAEQSQQAEKEWQKFIEGIFPEEKGRRTTVPENDWLLQIEKLQTQMAEQVEKLHIQLMDCDRQLNSLQNQREQLQEIENQLTELQAEYLHHSYQAELLKKTVGFLEQAKISFTEKYRSPLLRGFQKYYQQLTGQMATEFMLNAEMHLTKEEAGQQREISILSTGYQDLVGLCMRMALIDAMYPQEKPFLIFDDPFVHFDQAKTEKAIEFLKAISQEYQVIYFTCHQSRKG
ncbi:hypothetical protein EII17_02720 [Clostridiales bacterium COT073_COT-073]|nr:hypothetical protein EII17_02720 [Clostridiales bacterium COT073_COT-073]